MIYFVFVGCLLLVARCLFVASSLVGWSSVVIGLFWSCVSFFVYASYEVCVSFFLFVCLFCFCGLFVLLFFWFLCLSAYVGVFAFGLVWGGSFGVVVVISLGCVFVLVDCVWGCWFFSCCFLLVLLCVGISLDVFCLDACLGGFGSFM